MKLSNKLKIFISLGVLYSVLAVPLLKAGWNNQGAGPGVGYQLGPNNGDILIGVVYALLLTSTGYLLARVDKRRGFRGNIALQYHFTAAILVSVVAVLGWLLLAYFGWRYVAWLMIVGWGSYGLHWLKVHNDPKGIKKHAAFK